MKYKRILYFILVSSLTLLLIPCIVQAPYPRVYKPIDVEGTSGSISPKFTYIPSNLISGLFISKTLEPS